MSHPTDQQIKILNSLVEPFVLKNCDKPIAVGITDRGCVITLSDASKILVRIYDPGEEIPE